jgi:hypothetical protein
LATSLTVSAPAPAGHWHTRHTAACVGIFAAFVGVGVYVPYFAIGSSGDASNARLFAWAAMAALLIAFLCVVGNGVNGFKRAVLVDSRNRISLAKLQMAAWTVLLLSAYAAATFANIGTGQPNPLDVSIPRELWLAMGISTTSLIGSPLILNGKKADAQTQRRQKEYARQIALLAEQGVAEESLERMGSLVGYKHPRQSRWSDLFQGEETGNAGLIDLAKVQMFFFTLILILAYSLGIGDTLASARGDVASLPHLDQSMIALLGISHAGYLGKKALPKPPA